MSEKWQDWVVLTEPEYDGEHLADQGITVGGPTGRDVCLGITTRRDLEEAADQGVDAELICESKHEDEMRLAAAAVNSYGRHCANPLQAAQADLLGELISNCRMVMGKVFESGVGDRAFLNHQEIDLIRHTLSKVTEE